MGSWVNDTIAPATGVQVNAADPSRREEPAGSALKGGRGAHRRGGSTVLGVVSGRDRWPGGSGRPGAAAETRRSTAASGWGHGDECRKAQGQPRAPRPSRSRAVPRQGSLTSSLPQTQPDSSVQAWEPTLSMPGPWKRRRPSRDARKAVRSSSRVNVCGWRHHGWPERRGESLSARGDARNCRTPWGCAQGMEPEPSRLLT